MSDSTQFPLNFLPERKIYTVGELSRAIREKLETAFPEVWVEGEISNCRPAPSGHLYFTLKDEAAQLRCICFKQQARYMRFRPEDGMQVLARGRLGVYEARGEYQLLVEHLEPLGAGALQLAFEQLKKKLAAEGLFDADRKKPLPKLPRRIGIITSPRGAVIQDMIRILERRHKNLHLLLYPVRVQGEGAAEEMVEGLQCFNTEPPQGVAVDVIILARGGGSLEDLWAFNEEKLARAIAASRTPVISAVGHETDFTIADFVADLRAPTPSAAAEMVIESQEQLLGHIASLEADLVQVMRYHLLQRRHELAEMIGRRGFQMLRMTLMEAEQQLDELSLRLSEAVREKLRELQHRWEAQKAYLKHFDLRGRQERAAMRVGRFRETLVQQARLLLARKRSRMEALAAALGQLSPRKILERGYAIALDATGKVITDAAQVAAGDDLTLRLARGSVGTVVKKVERE